MLQDILSKIAPLIRKSQLISDEKFTELFSLLSRYNKGEWVYPGVLVRKIDITPISAYKVLELLKDQGLLQTNYEMYCHHCHRFEGGIYETISQIPYDLCCETCFEPLTVVDNAIAIYRVLKDEE